MSPWGVGDNRGAGSCGKDCPYCHAMREGGASRAERQRWNLIGLPQIILRGKNVARKLLLKKKKGADAAK